ncbi:MAG: hypothetical protein OXI75_06635 [Rhodospirillales bacterium]|nr:hypothetical protein [Rhodospirillales bacterium]
MPDGIDREAEHGETRPANGQQHERWSGTRGGNLAEDVTAGAGSAPSGDGPAPPAPNARAGQSAAEKHGGDTQTPSETLLAARHLLGLLDEHERQGQGLPQASQEYTEQPGELHGGGAAGTRAPPERSPNEASASGDETIGVVEELTAALRTCKADFARWADNERRRRRRWAGLAMATGFPACVLLGLLVEMQFQVIPLHDPTRGWGEHIWNNYGRIIVDCELEAMRTNSEVDCPLVVRRP